jgi:hypothetical protein
MEFITKHCTCESCESESSIAFDVIRDYICKKFKTFTFQSPALKEERYKAQEVLSLSIMFFQLISDLDFIRHDVVDVFLFFRAAILKRVEIKYPDYFYLLETVKLKALSSFPKHEDALKAGLLKKVPFSIESCPDHYTFISHRWPAPGLPDDGKLFNRISKDVTSKYIWFDYTCVPQDDSTEQMKHILSLPWFILYSEKKLQYAPHEISINRGWMLAEALCIGETEYTDLDNDGIVDIVEDNRTPDIFAKADIIPLFAAIAISDFEFTPKVTLILYNFLTIGLCAKGRKAHTTKCDKWKKIIELCTPPKKFSKEKELNDKERKAYRLRLEEIVKIKIEIHSSDFHETFESLGISL